MPRENKSRFAVLGMLTFAAMSGYDMKKLSDHSVGHFWNENYGNIYPVLKKMVSESLVTMEEKAQEGAPTRKVYTITDTGRAAFQAWMERKPDATKLREELLLQVFFGHWVGPEAVIAKLRAEDERCAGIIAELEEVKKHMAEEKEADAAEELKSIREKGMPYWQCTVSFGLDYYRGMQDWCARSIMEMENLN